MSDKKIELKAFDIQAMDRSFVAFVPGKPKSGKSSLSINFAFYNRDKYPCAKIYTHNDDAYRKWQKIFGPLFVSNKYDEQDHKNLILRKRMLAGEFGNDCHANNILEIYDDIAADRRILRNKCFKTTLKVSTQHHSNAVFINSQAVVDFEAQLRSSISYAFIFGNDNVDEREKLYKNFGGVCGSAQDFYKILDEVTAEPFTCLVIKLISESSKFEDRVFYYTTDDPDKFTDKGAESGIFRFGCDEVWDWVENRYNTEYVETYDDEL